MTQNIDPWHVVAGAREQRGHIVAGWCAHALVRLRARKSRGEAAQHTGGREDTADLGPDTEPTGTAGVP
jgi:hypothetical protein